MHRHSLFKEQVLPVALTFIVAAFLTGFLWLEIVIINHFIITDILLQVSVVDILVGLTIYLKTSIDFAIYIGRLMESNPGWKGRVAIEIGTAFGNAAGTFIVLALWAFFKDIRWLMALMITIAALVLFKLAEEGLEHAKEGNGRFPSWFHTMIVVFERVIGRFNKLVMPVLRYVIPNISMRSGKTKGFWSLFAFSFSVPFVLGLDDFAGYVPLFSIVNVFGFAIGVFVGHMILNIFLYLSPKRTIKAVKNPVISFLGSIAFVGLGIWGLIEVVELIGH